jgi:flagellar biosynthesis chaperone FliJ
MQLDARLEHKLKSLAKYHKIVEDLRRDIYVIKSEKEHAYFHLMNGKKSLN